MNQNEKEIENKIHFVYKIINKNAGGLIDSLGEYGLAGHIIPSSTKLLFQYIKEYLFEHQESLTSQTFLDLGSGDGYILFSAAALGCKTCIGIDHNPFILYQSFLHFKKFQNEYCRDTKDKKEYAFVESTKLIWYLFDLNKLSIEFFSHHQISILYSFSFAFLPQTCWILIQLATIAFKKYFLKLFILPMRSILTACSYGSTSIQSLDNQSPFKNKSKQKQKKEEKENSLQLISTLKKIVKFAPRFKIKMHEGKQTFTCIVLKREYFC